MPNALMLAALEYESKGFSVIPLKPRDKIPLIPSWSQFQHERADRSQIGEWWRTWPTANIGIVTGKISGLSVIDADSPQAASVLKPLLGDMTDVGIGGTGKGFHLYYAHDGVLRSNKAAIQPQIDFRGDGGYVVAPPSIHANGKHYEWVKPINGHLRELPAEFIKLMETPVDTAGVARARFDTAAALAGIPAGQRDETLFKLASKLRGADVPYDVAMELCEQAAANCVPPFREARRKVDQAYKYPAGHTQQQTEPDPDPSFWPMPTTIKDFLLQEDPAVDWLWDRLIPQGEVAMLCGEPRAGKTTLALNLALAVSRGIPFLGRATSKAKCLYVAIDNSRRDMKILCAQLGIIPDDDLHIHIGKIPVNSTDWCLDIAVKIGAKLIIIDTIERFFERHDINKPDFAKAMYPLDLEAKRIGITPMYVHHATAKPGMTSTTGSLFMGHTTVKGMTPYYFEMIRVGEYKHRILSSDLRSGDNIQQMFVKIDRDSGWSIKGGKIEDALMEEYTDRIIAVMHEKGQATRQEIRDNIIGRKQLINISISQLLDNGTLERVDPLINTGKPHHPEILCLAQKLI